MGSADIAAQEPSYNGVPMLRSKLHRNANSKEGSQRIGADRVGSSGRPDHSESNLRNSNDRGLRGDCKLFVFLCDPAHPLGGVSRPDASPLFPHATEREKRGRPMVRRLSK